MHLVFFLVFLFVCSTQAQTAKPTCDELLFDQAGRSKMCSAYVSEYTRGIPSRTRPDGIALNILAVHELNLASGDIPDFGEPRTPLRREFMSLLTERSRRRAVPPARQTVIKEMILNLRDLAKARIPTPTNSTQTRMLSRLDSLKVSFDGNDENCIGVGVNASYLAKTNTINVCPGLAQEPLESLVGILAHEIAHALETCSSNVWKIRDGMRKTLAEGTQRLQCTDPNFEPYVREAITSMPATETIIDPTEHFENQSFLLQINNCGVISDERFLVNESPFVGIETCTANLVRSETRNEADSNLEQSSDVAASLTEEGRPEVRVPYLWMNDAGCLGLKREAFADQLGAELTNEYVRTHASLRTGAESDLLYRFLASTCANDTSYESGVYPRARDRLTAYLAQPNIQNLLGCSGLSRRPLCPSSQSSGRGSTTPATSVERGL